MRKRLNSEKGLSLLEVFASILLISIILLSFFGLFVQSKKTGAVSEEIVDATYLAQTELENIYSVIKNGDIGDLEIYLSTQNYSSIISLTTFSQENHCVSQVGDNDTKNITSNSLSGRYEKNADQYDYILKFKEVCDTQGLYLVSITINDTSNKTKSFMETAYFIRRY